MKTAISLVFVLGSGLSLNAQITAVLNRVPIDNDMRRQFFGDVRLPVVEIRNNSSVSLAAFAISMAPTTRDAANSASLVVYVDAAVDQTATPLLPGQNYTVPVPIRFRHGKTTEDLFEPPVVSAGVYVDGTTSGDAALLARLILRRCNMLQAVELASAMLSDAGGHNVSRRQLIEQFRNMADSVNHWYLPPEQQVGNTLYESIVERLMNLPEVQVESPFPPTTFVEQETALLNRQRTTLLQSQPGLNLADAAPFRR
jgi:hypothetical protein